MSLDFDAAHAAVMRELHWDDDRRFDGSIIDGHNWHAALRAATAALEDSGAVKLAETCSCGDLNPETYEGPQADCAVHGAIRAFNEASREIEQLRKRLETAQREADTWWKRSETQVDIIADLRIKVQQLQSEIDAARLDREEYRERLDDAQRDLRVLLAGDSGGAS